MKETIFGYWNNSQNMYPDFPFPEKCSEIWDKNTFLRCLQKVEEKSIKRAYRGISLCRICGEFNGSEEFVFEVRNKKKNIIEKIIWPSGFKHYVIVHDVKPCQEFIDFILKYGE